MVSMSSSRSQNYRWKTDEKMYWYKNTVLDTGVEYGYITKKIFFPVFFGESWQWEGNSVS